VTTGRVFGDSRCRVLTVSAAAVAGTTLFAVTAASDGLGHTLAQGMAGAGGADRRWLLGALAAFLASLVATAGGWRSTLTACGGQLGAVDACARYGAGSLVNTVLPARLGEAVRVGLFSKAFRPEQSGRTLTTVGALAAVTAADTLTQSLVVGAAASVGPVPVWSLAALGGVMTCAGGAAVLAARRFRTGASAASLGIPHALEAGLVMCAVVIVATAVPLTPGNVGVTSGAIVLALHAQGVQVASAVAAGLVFHAVELSAGILFGLGGALALVPYPSVAVRRWSLGITVLFAGALLAAGVGTAFVPQLA